MLTRDEAKKLSGKILSYSKFPECEIRITSNEDAFVRFANNGLTTSGFTREQSARISSARDRKTGVISVNQFDDTSLREGVGMSEKMAGVAPPNEEAVPSLPPQDYPAIARFDEGTSRARSPGMIVHAKAVIEAARNKELVSAGFVSRTAGAAAIANKNGLFGYTTITDSSLSATVRTPGGDGSGWASQAAIRFAEIDGAEVARRAAGKCIASRKPKRIEPGKYTVVLEPAALGALLTWFSRNLDARAADEGRSFLSKKDGGNLLGEKMFPEIVTLRSDPASPQLPALPWGWTSWIPSRPVVWIDKGVVKNLNYDRYWAMKKKVNPSPPADNLVLDGGNESLDDLIRATERGLLITHFWYIRFVNPKTLQLTGLTRDGLFLIENGKVTDPVMNLRFNESPVRLLQNAKRIGRPVRIGEDETNAMLAPPVQAAEFTFSSVSDAV